MKEAIIIGSGMIGGKAAGYFKAKQHLEREDVRQLNPDLASRVRFPKTVCITTDCFTSFIKENNLLPEIQKYRWSEETAYDRLKEYFLQGKFSETLLNSFRAVLQKMTYPLAVRSSSVLEDRAGTSFAGKYLTLFISNRGTLEERLGQLCEAIKRVYAATYSPDALYYREKHDLLEETEQMAILLQQAVGREYEGNFLPLVAGVAFSQNGFLWNSEIKKEEGIVRLVFGLGTRAVGRGYARIFSPGKPMARPEGTEAGEITKFSQGIVDVLDLQNNCLKEVRATNLVKDGLHCYPRAQKLFSLREDQYLYTP
ncbi:MAG: PEP/pyruvate-binding domain-containing protein, partial [bacterium]|nr:PEP/pyruvate-binding domain-containing protein [bacterium]